MAKVRVPKNCRPPERFKPFKAPPGSDDQAIGKRFKVKGIFRRPRPGEWFWYQMRGFGVGLFDQESDRIVSRYFVRVILEEAKD